MDRKSEESNHFANCVDFVKDLAESLLPKAQRQALANSGALGGEPDDSFGYSVPISDKS